MKRRKNKNKYTVGEHGQITNNRPVLSSKTQKLIEFMGMMSAISGYTDNTDDVIDVDDLSNDNDKEEDKIDGGNVEGTETVCD